MIILVLAARLVLAAVFIVSGVAKLADRAGSRKAVADFGVPGLLSGPVAAVLPPVEIAIALALLPARSALWAGLAGAAAGPVLRRHRHQSASRPPAGLPLLRAALV